MTPSTPFLVPSIAMQFSAPQGLKPGSSMFVGTFELIPTGFDGVENQGATALGALLDGSGSMIGDSIEEAKNALIQLIKKLPEAMRFFLVVFGNKGELLIPVDYASPANKKKWITAVEKFANTVDTRSQQSTYMGSGFAVLLQEIEQQLKGANVTVVAYTDGQINDEDEVQQQMQKLVTLRQRGFSIKGFLRGIGSNWSSSKLDAVSKSFLGDTELVGGKDYDMGADLAVILSEAAAQVIGDVRLTIWSPRDIKLIEISQQNPVQVPLIGSVMFDPTDPKQLTTLVPIGSLSKEPVRYFFYFELTPHAVGEAPVTAAKIGLRYLLNGQEVVIAPTRLQATWTSDQAVYGNVPEATRRALKEKDTARYIEEADAHLQAGRVEQATRRYADALIIAEAAGNQELVERLQQVVNVDRATGRISAGNLNDVATKRVRSASRRTGRVGAEETA